MKKLLTVLLVFVLLCTSCTKADCEHEYSDWKTTLEATCIEAGEKAQTCSKCGHERLKEIAPLGHDYKNGVCSVCGEKDPDYKPELERGETTSTQYKNDSLGLTFNLPSGWRFYTDSEIASMLNITVEMFKDPELFNNVSSAIDFMALNPTTGDNVNLSFEKLNGTSITLEQYSATVKALLPSQLQGAKYTFDEDTKVKLGGIEFLKISAKCTYNGITMSQYMYICLTDTHVITASATSVTGQSAAVYEAMFE